MLWGHLSGRAMAGVVGPGVLEDIGFKFLSSNCEVRGSKKYTLQLGPEIGTFGEPPTKRLEPSFGQVPELGS